MHPEIRVALETFPANLAEMEVLREQFHSVELHDFAVGIRVIHCDIVVVRWFDFRIVHMWFWSEAEIGRWEDGDCGDSEILRVRDKCGGVDYGVVDGGGDLVGDDGYLIVGEGSVGVDGLGEKCS